MRTCKHRFLGVGVIVAVLGTLLRSPVFAQVAGGRSFYVDPAGSDSNSGQSPAQAWRTLKRVNAVILMPGDTVYLRRGGLWRETLEPHNGGAPGRPVTFTSYGHGPKPIIDGSDLIAGWTVVGNGVYRAYSAQPNNVYVDGGPGWGLNHARSIESAGPGDWYWERSTSSLYVHLLDASNPSDHAVEAAVRVSGIRVVADGGEKSNMIIDGLAIERTAGYGMFFFSNTQNGAGTTGIIIRDNTVTQTGTGQDDQGQYYNAIHFSEHTELETAPRFIDNDISYSGGHGNAINSQNADGAQLIGNRAEHFNHHGFDTKGSAAVIIRGNVAHDSPDKNGIYQEHCADGLIEQNVVYNLDGTVPGRGSGIQIDVGSSGARIYNNSIFNVLTGIYLTVPATVRYNAVSDAHGAVLEASAGGIFDHNLWGLNPSFAISGHHYNFAQWLSMGGHQGDLAEDPEWENPGQGDFTLVPTSPCFAVKAGVTQNLSPRS